MLRLVGRHKESSERVKWRGEERGRGPAEVTDWPPTRLNLYGKVHQEGAVLSVLDHVGWNVAVPAFPQCLALWLIEHHQLPEHLLP